MKLIGYWIESLRDTNYYPPQELMGDLPLAIRTQVADYLDRGHVFEVYRGRSWCRFFCEHLMGCRELTDGYWVWPEDLSHYVRDHGVIVPLEFIRHVESRPTPIPTEQWDRSRLPDEEFWKAWCRQNASGEYRAKLNAARERADCETERLFANAITELEATKRTSDADCQWAGCGNKALVGKVFCARCILNERKDQIVFVSGIYHDMRSILVDAEPR
jgi:hypothetical protein